MEEKAAKIVTVCPSKFRNGVVSHLQYLENTTELSQHLDLNCKTLVNILSIKPDLVIFGGAWSQNYKFITKHIREKLPETKVASLFCSPYGQTEINHEQLCLLTSYNLLRSKVIDVLFVGSERMANTMGEEVVWLPQTMPPDCLDKYHTLNKEPLTCSILSHTAANKNFMNQAIGVRDAYMTLNMTQVDPNTQILMEALDINFKVHGVLADPAFYGLMASMKVGMHASFSEAFCYAAIEQMLVGSHILVGPTIDWMPESLSFMKVQNIDDPREIKKSLDYISDFSKEEYEKYSKLATQTAKDILVQNNKIAEKVLLEYGK